ncbi:hypothetical protein EUX98_g2542 [Antrodiella citrinella]|uniref:HMG box domain-containing protein n=1 Tax=Antrodiella citrinella TaxID=2447956 RepID=A0A4S4N1K0_9APHY|nr:hypothetical protein EUX98_g2542 [Antrodiella citrinella]
MSPVRNHGRVFESSPTPYTTDELSDVHQQSEVASPSSSSSPSFTTSSSQWSTSPATSISTVLSTPTLSPAISESSVSDSLNDTAPSRRRVSRSRKKVDAQDAPYIRRPPNPFIIFRSAFWNEEKKKTSCVKDHRVISKMAGEAWRNLTVAEQSPYRKIAYEVKRRHQEEFPDYRYAPIHRRTSPSSREYVSKDQDEVRCKAIAEFIMEGLKGPQLAAAIQQLDEGSMLLPAPSPSRVPTPVPNMLHPTEAFSTLLKLEYESPVLVAPVITPQEPLPTAQTPELTPAPAIESESTFFTPAELKPRFTDPLLSGIHFDPSAIATFSSTFSSDVAGPIASLDSESAQLLYTTFMSDGADNNLFQTYDQQTFNLPSLPDQTYIDPSWLSSSLYPVENDGGFQGALGLQPYGDMPYPDLSVLPSGAINEDGQGALDVLWQFFADPTVVDSSAVKDEPQTYEFDDLSGWFKTDFFESP